MKMIRVARSGAATGVAEAKPGIPKPTRAPGELVNTIPAEPFAPDVLNDEDEPRLPSAGIFTDIRGGAGAA